MKDKLLILLVMIMVILGIVAFVNLGKDNKNKVTSFTKYDMVLFKN